METLEKTSLEAYCIGAGITAKVEEDYNDKAPEWALRNGSSTKHYRVTLRYKGRRFSLWFYQGSAIKEAPKAWHVLESLLSDSTFADCSMDDYISELGYEIKSADDYRSLVSTMNQIKRQTKALKRLISNDEFMASLMESAGY
jgi:hypothetical protein